MEISEAVLALEALAQESRLGIFRLLVQTGPEGLAAGRIAEYLRLPAATLSFHLAQLKHAGLIDCRRDGRSLVYSPKLTAMNDIIRFLTENCCGGDLSKCAPMRRPRRKAKTG